MCVYKLGFNMDKYGACVYMYIQEAHVDYDMFDTDRLVPYFTS